MNYYLDNNNARLVVNKTYDTDMYDNYLEAFAAPVRYTYYLNSTIHLELSFS